MVSVARYSTTCRCDQPQKQERRPISHPGPFYFLFTIDQSDSMGHFNREIREEILAGYQRCKPTQRGTKGSSEIPKGRAILVVPLSKKIINLAEARKRLSDSLKDKRDLIKGEPKNPHITLWYNSIRGEWAASIASLKQSFEFMVQQYEKEGKMRGPNRALWYIRGGGDLQLFGTKVVVPATFPSMLKKFVV